MTFRPHISPNIAPIAPREDFSEYVAHLQLHMALQTRRLVPNMAQGNDSRAQLLQDTQAQIEKHVSRQIF
jgi:hypothetical protein